MNAGSLAASHTVIDNLQSITTLAAKQVDRGVYLMACLMQAMAYLMSNAPDALEGASQSMGAVWQFQMDVGNQVPQLFGIAHILNVVCAIREGSPEQMHSKLVSMQSFMDPVLADPSRWSHTTDHIAIPIKRVGKVAEIVSADTRMILGLGDDGCDHLFMSFLNMKDAYSIS